MMDKAEYEIEHFGFSVEQASLERKIFLKKILSGELDAMLKKIDCANVETSQFLEKKKQEVLEDMYASLGNQMNVADEMDMNYFSIPDHVLLPSDFEHTKEYTEADEQQLDTKLDVLKKEFLENTVMLNCLKLESEQYNNLESFIANELVVHEKLKKALNSNKYDVERMRALVEKTLSIEKEKK